MKIEKKIIIFKQFSFLASTTIGCSVNNSNNAGNKLFRMPMKL